MADNRSLQHRLQCIAAGGAAAMLAIGVASASPAVTVKTPWFRYLLPTIPAGGYMTLANGTDKPIELTGARSSACGMMMLHKSVTRNGMDEMLPVKRITIPAHGSFAFSPGHYHVMCMQPHMKPGESVPVELEFAGLPSVTTHFTVFGAAGKPGSK